MSNLKNITSSSFLTLTAVVLSCSCATGGGSSGDTDGTGGVRNDLGLGNAAGGATADTGGTTGNTGGNGEIGSGGGTPTGSGGSTLGSGTPAVVPYSGACTASLVTLGAGDEPIADFEPYEVESLPAGAFGTTGWNFYATGADAGGTSTQEITAEGADGSQKSLKIVSGGYTKAGWNVQLSQGCINVEAFTGITFWAKGLDADVIEFALQIPQRESSVHAPEQGDCDTDAPGNECYLYPNAGIELSSEWQQYAIGFLDVGQPTASEPDPWAGVIIGFHFHLPMGGVTGSDHTVFIDQMRFYSGEAPAGSIGPVTN